MYNQIYNIDCLEGMREIPDGAVDLICTDPPYCIGVTANGLKGNFNDLYMIKPFWECLCAEWLRILKDGAHIYINTDWRTYPFLYPILQKYFIVRNLIVWDYEWLKMGNFYRFSHEFIIFATNGKSLRKFSNTAENRDVWQMRPVNVTQARNHPSEKPIGLCEKMILNSSAENDVVLDCFIGSGSTAVACVNTGRQFIGYETDAHYFEVAQRRIREAQAKKAQELFDSTAIE